MDGHMFNPTDPISILDFLLTFRRAFKNSSINEGAAVFLLSNFVLGNAKQELLHRYEGDSDIDDSTMEQTGSLRSYDEVVNDFLATYANNSTIYATDATIKSL